MTNAEQNKISYSLGTNFDIKLLENLIKLDKENKIKTIFGKLNKDILGGGRYSYVLPEISFNDLVKHVEICQKNKIKFNYLLNPMCMNNKEFIKKDHKKIIKFLEKLSNIDIKNVTINSPYLAKIIKKQFPHINITLGIYAGVYSLQLIKYWEDLGVSEITLTHELNRRFKYLEQLLFYTKKSGTKLRLIANNGCLHYCPNGIYHGTCISHGSQSGKKNKDFILDYCYLDCAYKKIKNPVKFISSNWIRPEDIKYYEDICIKTNNYNLDIKLLERTNTTDFLTNVIKAYLNQSYDGNLLNLLNWYSTNIDNKKYLKYLKSENSNYNNNEIKKYISLLNFPEIYVDNKKLDGFINKFIINNECFNNICDDEDLDITQNRNKCNFCKKWATKSIKYDNNEIKEWLEKADAFFESFYNGKLYKKVF